MVQTKDTPSARWKRERGLVKHWIYTIARNRLIDYLRKQNELEVPFTDVPPVTEEGEEREFAEMVEQSMGAAEALPDEIKQALRQCVDELPPQEQEAVKMKFWDELQQTEIARILGVSDATVTRLLQHAYTLLKECLRRKGAI